MLRKELVSIFDYFFVLRPTLFFPAWTIFLAGYFAHNAFMGGGNATVMSISILWGEIDWRALAIGGSVTLLLGGAFIINQIADIETDRQNHKLFLIANGHIPVQFAIWEALLLVVASIGFAFTHSFFMGILFLAVFFITSVFYSVRPFVWKDRPLLGLAANAISGFVGFMIGWSALNLVDLLWAALHAIPYALAISSVYLCTTLLDVAGDAKTGKKTFGVRFGLKITTLWALILDLAAIGFGFALNDWVIFFPAIISLPLFIASAHSLRMSLISKAIKFPIFFLSMAICLIWPGYFLLVLFIFVFSRWYYRKRFNLNYPSFTT